MKEFFKNWCWTVAILAAATCAIGAIAELIQLIARAPGFYQATIVVFALTIFIAAVVTWGVDPSRPPPR